MQTDELQAQIQAAYRSFLAGRNLQPRGSQKHMIADIVRLLTSVEQDDTGRRESPPVVAVIEAGTGTGKTLAYAVAAIPVAQKLGKQLVISTATINLQSQLVDRDLPDLLKHSALEFRFVLAKGRRRYLCPSRLESVLNEEIPDPGLLLYPDELPEVDSKTAEHYRRISDSFLRGDWEGDLDSWPEFLGSHDRERITIDNFRCAGRRCSWISRCPFFAARDLMQDAEVIVANHDLVLADLSLGGGVVLPAPEDTIYVIDEGHHLPDKALQHFSAHMRIMGAVRWAGQTRKALQQLVAMVSPLTGVLRVVDRLQPALGLVEELHQRAYDITTGVAQFPALRSGDHAPHFRFAGGVVPELLRLLAVDLVTTCQALVTTFDLLGRELRDAQSDAVHGLDAPTLESAVAAVGMMQGRVVSMLGLWRTYADVDSGASQDAPLARWLTLVSGDGMPDIEICSSPIESGTALTPALWQRSFATIVTSATLTALGSFDRFRLRSGAPEGIYKVYPSPFDFARAATLHVPRLPEPGDQDAHTHAIAEYLPQALAPNEAALVLFFSRRQMEAVYHALPSELRSRILLQGASLSRSEMVKQHCERIDAGNGSVIFGLSSFAEGVDLPGKYCRHVVIARIPFSVPDQPVEEAEAEWIKSRGGNPFMQIAVPDAAMKLVQATGRLLRSESDTGRISLLDRRVVSKRYGQQILDSLPPYRRVID